MKISLIKKILPSALLLVGVFVFGAGNANAQFNPGRIIDDGVFTNKSAMSVNDIQNFLNSKVPNCETNHAPGSGSQGEQPPWTCLKNYSENGKSAAQIIWEHSQNYNLNPQVILVTLQKENGLITDTWPYNWQYRTAMGMGCPDGAACDSQYFGFNNQVGQGARHLRNFYDQNPNWYIPYRPGVSFIKWHPNSACGGTNVNIENRATASLYSYTPYQPNSAALSNMYGTGDGCSSYGNRNFWRDFSNWFGTTRSPSYAWEFVSQSSSKNLSSLPSGEKATWSLTVRNVGTVTWSNSGANPIRLGTNQPRDRASPFATSSWIAPHRAATLNEAAVAPGETGTFTFQVQAPSNTGYRVEYFNLVAEGITWLNDPGLGYGVNVVPQTITPTLISNGLPSTMTAGSVASGNVVLRNDGNATWFPDGNFPIRIGTSSPRLRESMFSHSSWEEPSIASKLVGTSVAPGEQGTFSITLQAPPSNSTYTETFALMVTNLKWADQEFSKVITVSGGADLTKDPVYRLYNPYSRSHFFTADPAERDFAKGLGFGYEGIGFYMTKMKTSKPVYRLYNPYSRSHFFTADPAERDFAKGLGFGYEGIVFYATP